MGYQKDFKEETEYLESTLNYLKSELDKESVLLLDRKDKLIASRREMWEDTVHYVDDFEKLTELNQYLVDETAQTAGYGNILKKIEKYKRLLNSPYFGRFDFIEDECDEEKIYIGLASLIDSSTGEIFVYDWRAPISRIFYQYELGDASYNSPDGPVQGKVTLKRQYKIHKSKLDYFFDSNVRINDEILQEILGHNSSVRMKNIVESIQKEQDAAIRDNQNQLLIVQGVAGSGKTSIALHRVAFLLYEGLDKKISSQNIIIISPNMIFSKYISGVLPELGEENVTQITFEEYAMEVLTGKAVVEGKIEQLENIISANDSDTIKLKRDKIEFKGSECFAKILDRFVKYIEKHIVAFEDIYYDGKVIFSRQQLKGVFLDNRIGIPPSRRLKRIEGMIFDKIHPMRKKRIEKIEKVVRSYEGHEFEIKSFSRLLSIKEAKVFTIRLRRVTELDYFSLYSMLFSKKGLFEKMSTGLKLPSNIGEIKSSTAAEIGKGRISFEDCAPILYLKLKLEGCDSFKDIKHVVIDEAQDYSPMHYEVFNILFKDAFFTVLGDINQKIEKGADDGIYDYIIYALARRKSLKIRLNKSYRSSYEITGFSRRILGGAGEVEAMERHECQPLVLYKEEVEDIDVSLINDSRDYMAQGYESIAILCKTVSEAKKLYESIKDSLNISLIVSNEQELSKGITITPVYLAKGLEFDVVFVYNADRDNYKDELDRRLLYIACTRALHRLVLYYKGEKSTFIE